jgi:hypothetical protein
VSPLPKIALSALKTLTLIFHVHYEFWNSERGRECAINNLRTFFHLLLLHSLQQSLHLQVIHTHLNMHIGTPSGYIDTERDLGCLVDSVWPTISSSVMDEMKSLKMLVKCKFSITIVHQHNNAPLIGAEKRLEIEEQLKDVHPSMMNGTSEYLTIEWIDDAHCLGNPFTTTWK